jgi:predicted nucleic acid-binding protein
MQIKRVYWDANCWLGLINGEAAKFNALEHVYDAAKTGTYQIWTSTLSYVEVFRLKSEEGHPKPLGDANLDIIERAFTQDFVQLVTLDMEVVREARRLLRLTLGLGKRTDAVHLASTLRWSVDAMHTYDKTDLLHLDGKLKCRSGEFLKICEPDPPDHGPLFQQPLAP